MTDHELYQRAARLAPPATEQQIDLVRRSMPPVTPRPVGGVSRAR